MSRTLAKKLRDAELRVEKLNELAGIEAELAKATASVKEDLAKIHKLKERQTKLRDELGLNGKADAL